MDGVTSLNMEEAFWLPLLHFYNYKNQTTWERLHRNLNQIKPKFILYFRVNRYKGWIGSEMSSLIQMFKQR